MTNYIDLKPRLSEKAYALSNKDRTYVFVVPPGANKHSVSRAVTQQYEVEVQSVRITGIRGKVQRSYRKRGRVMRSRRADFKKAYVSLKEGHQLPIFSAVEEAEAKAEKAAQKEKK